MSAAHSNKHAAKSGSAREPHASGAEMTELTAHSCAERAAGSSSECGPPFTAAIEIHARTKGIFIRQEEDRSGGAGLQVLELVAQALTS